MTIDFESRFGELLTESVDAQLGPRRVVPAFDPTRPDSVRSVRSRAWFVPLIAAACVAVLALGLALFVHVVGDDRSPTRPAGRKIVHFKGASIAVPNGWAVEMSNETTAHGGVWHMLCIERLLPPGSMAPGLGCAVYIARVQPASRPSSEKPALDVDALGFGLERVPRYCLPGSPYTETQQKGRREFGGRVAEWRHSDITCRTGRLSRSSWEQYVVDSDPGFAMYSANAGAASQRLMRQIAAGSVLP